MADDDDEAVGSAAVGHYTIIPTLASLQQMRNRLNLAHVGMKLMKWSSLALGQEMRRQAGILVKLIKGYDAAQAFMMLARARYMCHPNFNNIITVNPQPRAHLTVKSNVINLYGGVRGTAYTLLDSGPPAYQHLGIGQGGTHVKETKQVWEDLLRKMLLILSVRNSYLAVERKFFLTRRRYNVIHKVIEPKTLNTIAYILLELDEQAREELYRIKKVVQVKARKNKKLTGQTVKCSECDEPMVSLPPPAPVPPPKAPSPPPTSPCCKPQLPQQKALSSCEVSLPTTVTVAPPRTCLSNTEPISKRFVTKPATTVSKSGMNVKVLLPKKGLSLEINNLKKKPTTVPLSETKPCCDTSPAIKPYTTQAQDESIEQALKNLRNYVETFKDAILNEGNMTPESTAACERRVDKINRELSEIAAIARPLQMQKSSIYDTFLDACSYIKVQLENIAVQLHLKTGEPCENLSKSIDKLLKMIEDLKKQGINIPGLEAFVDECYEMQSSIKVERNMKQNLGPIKAQISAVEGLADQITKSGYKSGNICKFKHVCRDFIEQISKHANGRQEGGLDELISNLNQSIIISKEAKYTKGAKTVNEFVHSCEGIKDYLEKVKYDTQQCSFKDKCDVQVLKSKIEKAMDLVFKLQRQGLIQDSLADFIKTCDITRKAVMGNDNGPSSSRNGSGCCQSAQSSASQNTSQKSSASNKNGNLRSYTSMYCNMDSTKISLRPSESICKCATSINDPSYDERKLIILKLQKLTEIIRSVYEHKTDMKTLKGVTLNLIDTSSFELNSQKYVESDESLFNDDEFSYVKNSQKIPSYEGNNIPYFCHHTADSIFRTKSAPVNKFHFPMVRITSTKSEDVCEDKPSEIMFNTDYLSKETLTLKPTGSDLIRARLSSDAFTQQEKLDSSDKKEQTDKLKHVLTTSKSYTKYTPRNTFKKLVESRSLNFERFPSEAQETFSTPCYSDDSRVQEDRQESEIEIQDSR